MDGKFSVRSCLEHIQGANSNRDNDKVWGYIWGSRLHEHFKIFLWLIALEVIPVKKMVANRIGIGDTICGLYGQEEEDVLHLFKKCLVSRAFDFASKGNNIKDMIKQLWLDHSSTGSLLKLLIISCLWYSIWHLRNEMHFHGLPVLNEVVLRFERSGEEFGSAFKEVKQRANAEVWVP